jgi:hypothetical protein
MALFGSLYVVVGITLVTWPYCGCIRISRIHYSHSISFDQIWRNLDWCYSLVRECLVDGLICGQYMALKDAL